MSLCCAQAAAAKVFLDERTKLSATTLNRNNNVKREDDTRVTSLSFGISEAAGGLRNGKCNFSPRPRPLLCRISQLEVADLAPSTSAAYGILLLLGGLFAFAKSASKGSLFGGLTGAALMASVAAAAMAVRVLLLLGILLFCVAVAEVSSTLKKEDDGDGVQHAGVGHAYTFLTFFASCPKL